MHNRLAIIPKPQKCTFNPGTFRLHPGDAMAFPDDGRLAGRLLHTLTRLAVSDSPASAIRLVLDPAVSGAEAYRLDIDPRGICIAALTPAGLYYGAQTLRQLLPPEVEQVGLAAPADLPCVQIEDAPRFAHRGFMLDVARHFFGVEEIKRVLDLLALQKLNRFHWHLTDDQGWRIEIKKYPRLAEIGSQRKQSQVAGWLLSRAVYDGTPYAGFYTQADIREIVAYARDRFIEVIPEIDAPGHASAAIAAYPTLHCSGELVDVRSTVTSFSNPMCVGSEFVFEFLDNVFSDLVSLFPYRHIHIGGDEVNKKAWSKCPACRQRMAQEGLKTGHDLQIYFANRLVKMLHARGCQVTGWNELLDEKLDDRVINQFWSPFGKKKTIAALQHRRSTIVSDFFSYYLDYSYAVMPLVKTYASEPHFDALSPAQAGAILGVEGALWTEYVASRSRLDWQMFPRLLAISEAGWTPREIKDYSDFLGRLAGFEKRLEQLGVHAASRDCYLQQPRNPWVPQLLKILLSNDHPGSKEYRRFNKTVHL